MSKNISNNNQTVKSKDFIKASPYYHSFSSALTEKERELREHGDYTLRSKAYTKDFGPIEEKIDLDITQPAKQPAVIEVRKSTKKSKKDALREKEAEEAKARKEQRKSRIEEAKLKKRKERIKKIKRKRIRKEKDQFFVMRKFVCFLMAILMLVILAFFGAGAIGIDGLEEYTALYKLPDQTPMDERVSTTDPDTDEEIPYEEQVGFVTFLDPIFGFIKHLADVELGDSPFYDEQIAKVEAGMEDQIAPLALQWFPIAMLLFILLGLITLIKAFFGMFGRRIYKRFGLTSIVLIIFAAAMLLAGFASNLAATDSLDFAGIMDFVTQLFAAPVDGEALVPVVAGFGLLGLVGIPVLTLLLSLGIRKKIPYSIFD